MDGGVLVSVNNYLYTNWNWDAVDNFDENLILVKAKNANMAIAMVSTFNHEYKPIFQKDNGNSRFYWYMCG
jgi:hypothetical protein